MEPAIGHPVKFSKSIQTAWAGMSGFTKYTIARERNRLVAELEGRIFRYQGQHYQVVDGCAAQLVPGDLHLWPVYALKEFLTNSLALEQAFAAAENPNDTEYLKQVGVRYYGNGEWALPSGWRVSKLGGGEWYIVDPEENHLDSYRVHTEIA